MTDQKETNMTILDPDEVERLAQLRAFGIGIELPGLHG